MKARKYLLSVCLAFVASAAQAATINYALDVDPAGTFSLYATTGNDSAGISGYGVDLAGDITSLVHSTPNSATANTNGTDFAPSGFGLARSADNSNFVLASQDVNNPGTHALYGVGQTSSSFADQGIIPINATFDAWDAQFLIATGTYSGDPSTVGFNESGPNRGGNVFVDDQGLAVLAADVTFTILGGAVVVGDPVDGSDISLQTAFDDASGVFADAIAVSGGNITGVTVSNDAEGLFGADFTGNSVSLTIDNAKAVLLPSASAVSADLLVSTDNGDLNYTLSATVPEPATLGLIGLALVGFVGTRRRS